MPIQCELAGILIALVLAALQERLCNPRGCLRLRACFSAALRFSSSPISAACSYIFRDGFLKSCLTLAVVE